MPVVPSVGQRESALLWVSVGRSPLPTETKYTQDMVIASQQPTDATVVGLIASLGDSDSAVAAAAGTSLEALGAGRVLPEVLRYISNGSTGGGGGGAVARRPPRRRWRVDQAPG